MRIRIHNTAFFHFLIPETNLQTSSVACSVVDPDPESDPDPIGSELFAGSGVGSGINHFGSESGQPLPGMNLK
jgi:hypothetical protein